MIVANLIGGLGNQMFQYAMGRQIAILNQDDLALDISGFDSYKLRAFPLPHLNVECPLSDQGTVA